MGRVAERFERHNHLMARCVATYQRWYNLDDTDLLQHLGLGIEQLARLITAPIPRPEHIRDDISGLAQSIGCPESVIWQLINGALNSPPES